MLVILTVQAHLGTGQVTRTVNFDAGTTRSEVYNWALGVMGLDRLSTDAYAVTFFYAEPDEVTG